MPDQALILRPDVVVTVLEEGAVLLDMDSKFFYSVNPAGWAVLQLFESGTTKGHVAECCRQWGAEETDLEAVNDFVAALEADSLIESGAPAGEVPPVSYDGKWMGPSLEKHKEPLQRIMTSAFDPSLPLAE